MRSSEATARQAPFFEPVAIVGRGCVLPGALDPDTFWARIAAGRSALSPVPDGRWRVPPARVSGAPGDSDRIWTDIGGYVHGFDEAFDPTGFELPPAEIAPLDRAFRWVLHAGRQALNEAGRPDLGRAGLVLGNLAYPTTAMARYAEHVWLSGWGRPGPGDDAGPDPLNRFAAGLPAHLAVRALGLGAGGHALDAACASSLYALKAGCDRLRDGDADLVLAGAVAAADNLYIHQGFCALTALSRSGRSRPFHREADGLVPAEGAVLFALARLDDALAQGMPVLGVIRGIGLSNDGAGGGLLAPDRAGQERAVRAAYASAGVAPETVSLVECHAPGTPSGDLTEALVMREVFADAVDLPIGSVKSNLGHPLTAAGGAGLLKVLGALRARVRPPSLHADAPLDVLAGTPLRLLREAEEWRGRRRAAVSAFGFGGANAHVVVDAWELGRAASTAALSPRPVPRRPRVDQRVAIVAIGARAGSGTGYRDLCHAVLDGAPSPGPRRSVEVALAGLRFPPADLAEALPQQVLALEAAREAASATRLPPDRTMVLIGMGTDPEAARPGARWRAPGWETASGLPAPVPDWPDAFRAPLVPETVPGTMPNLVAHRINTQLDLRGPSHVVCAEQASGLVALDLGARALRAGEADAVLAGAVDLSHEPVHLAALGALGDHRPGGDVAVVLVLKRLTDAERDGDRVIALLDHTTDRTAPVGLLVGDADAGGTDGTHRMRDREVPPDRDGDRTDRGRAGDQEDGDDRDDRDVTGEDGEPSGRPPTPRVTARYDHSELFGTAHAAHGALAVAVAAIAVHHQAVPRSGAAALPADAPLTACARVTPLGASPMAVRLRPAGPPLPWSSVAPRCHVFSGADRAGVLAALAEGRESGAGPARLVVVVDRVSETLGERLAVARHWLTSGGPRPDRIAYQDAPTGGEVAFVFPSGQASYPGCGAELRLALRAPRTEEAARPVPVPEPRHPTGTDPVPVVTRIRDTTELAALHGEITRSLLGLRPDAAIGFSSGESTALIVLGAWPDAAGLYQAVSDSDVFRFDLSGEFRAAHRFWRGHGLERGRWAEYLVHATPADVRAALAGEPLAHLLAVDSPDTCVIGGLDAACRRVLDRIGPGLPMADGYQMVAHAPEANQVAAAFRALHRRPTSPTPGIRYYSAATGEPYPVDPDHVADALLTQMTSTLDYPKVVERAWTDGVRVLIEHGPQSGRTRSIRRILADRDHLAVALDVPGRGLRQLCDAVAELAAAGVCPDPAPLFDRLTAAAGLPADPGRTITLPAHPPAIRLPGADHSGQRMEPAPLLPPATVPTTPVGAPPGPGTAAPSDAQGPASPRARAVPVARTASTGPVTAADHPVPPLAAANRRAPAVAAADDPVPALAAAHHARLAVAQREYLERQGRAHATFLRTRQLVIGSVPATAAGGDRALSPAPDPAHLPQAVEPAPVAIPSPGSPAPPWPPAVPERPARGLSLPLERARLEYLAHGRISDVFGPAFRAQDHKRRQTRLPRPPMLLVDRVTRLDAEPGSMSTGTVHTETYVAPDAWYLDPAGRMPAGLFIEAGQADLLLISWLGADLLDHGDRVYRLLGCEVTYHGPRPSVGETLRYEIHVEGHAEHDGVRLFFFRSDCYVGKELRLSVRQGQAGYFTDAELAGSQGVLWSPGPSPAGAVDPPAVPPSATAFGPDAVRAFAEGRPADCFGPGWDVARAHVRTPTPGQGRLWLLDEVSELDPAGGPWGRGYLRAESEVRPDDWFFDGHFHNDPCMPGTLMFEGCVQAMAFYLAALGFTLDRDGWRFEPVSDESYRMRCRGQVTPRSRRVRYEVFVSGLSSRPLPTLRADLLCTVDGLPAFHASGVGLALVPDWPLEYWRWLGPPAVQTSGAPVPLPVLGGLRGLEPDPAAATLAGRTVDFPSMLAAAWGRPSVFGTRGTRFDGGKRCARLPGPPYLFVTRIVDAGLEPDRPRPGSWLVAEYDVPEQVWYFEENGTRVMPFAVLNEVVLQPCGMAASLLVPQPPDAPELFFRNLQGNGTVLREVPAGTRTLRTRVEMGDPSQFDGVTLVPFEVFCEAVDETGAQLPVMELSTQFGYFPAASFARQPGLPPSAAERARLAEPCDRVVELRHRQERHGSGSLRLPGPMLLMLDRITAYWPDAGRAGLGRLRAERKVDAGDWYFRAHFFTDPVQPGSLGLEGVVQLLQWYLLERDAGTGLTAPRFESVAVGHEVRWLYRGQVVPSDGLVTFEAEITEYGTDARGRYACAEAWLWVDGRRIYHLPRIGVRVVDGHPAVRELELDPAVDTWLDDHRPNFVVPAVPMMTTVDQLAAAAARLTGQPVVGLREVQLHRWLPLPGPVRIRTDAEPAAGEGTAARLSVWREAGELSRYEVVGEATVLTGAVPGPPPALFPPLPDGRPQPDPYEAAELFHGPALRYLTSLTVGSTGSSAVLDAGRGTTPFGQLGQGLLDGFLHAIPSQSLWRWIPGLSRDLVGYPHRLPWLDLYEPLPTSGELRVEARFAGFDQGHHLLPMIDVQARVGTRLVARLRLVEFLVRLPGSERMPLPDRRAFATGLRYVPTARLSHTRDGITTLSVDTVRRFDTLPGTTSRIYRLPAGLPLPERSTRIAVKEHVSGLARAHPGQIEVAADLRSAWVAGAPGTVWPVRVEPEADVVVVRCPLPDRDA
ncbi:beta-ketoacyl synthase N-terminal-like domain-containing protein [Streptomyces sp. NPDC059712]|uniref:beta-ketoacyl synthase N-terminal-like domain-containing protein n=1 Tax=Streptomyces sp. NPDC059712 TaxID=3346919 RepID=UPI00368686C0